MASVKTALDSNVLANLLLIGGMVIGFTYWLWDRWPHWFPMTFRAPAGFGADPETDMTLPMATSKAVPLGISVVYLVATTKLGSDAFEWFSLRCVRPKWKWARWVLFKRPQSAPSLRLLPMTDIGSTPVVVFGVHIIPKRARPFELELVKKDHAGGLFVHFKTPCQLGAKKKIQIFVGLDAKYEWTGYLSVGTTAANNKDKYGNLALTCSPAVTLSAFRTAGIPKLSVLEEYRETDMGSSYC